MPVFKTSFFSLLLLLTLGLFSVVGVRAEAVEEISKFSFCGELKSAEVTSSLYSWGVAQVFNESNRENPLVVLNDYEAISAVMNTLPIEEISLNSFRDRKVWTSPIGAESTYVLCFMAERRSNVLWGMRILSSFSSLTMVRLFRRGDLILDYSGLPNDDFSAIDVIHARF